MIRLEHAEAYRLWAPEYDSTPNPLLALEERVIGGMLRRAASGLVLDVGCGTGRWERVLRPARYFGVDMCPQMLRGTRCAAGDALTIPVADAAAGLTICSFILGYVQELDAALKEWARVTRRGGTLAISDLHPDSGWSRSFRLGSEVYEIEHRVHAAQYVLDAASRAGLRLQHELAVPFGEAERPVFRAAGREDLLERVSGTPAVWAAVWVRP